MSHTDEEDKKVHNIEISFVEVTCACEQYIEIPSFNVSAGIKVHYGSK